MLLDRAPWADPSLLPVQEKSWLGPLLSLAIEIFFSCLGPNIFIMLLLDVRAAASMKWLFLVTFLNQANTASKQSSHGFQIKPKSLGRGVVPSCGTVGNLGFQLYLPKEILSDVASLFSQNDTQDMTTKRIHGPYTSQIIRYIFSVLVQGNYCAIPE